MRRRNNDEDMSNTELGVELGEPFLAYKSDIVLGQKYRDTITGYEGVATTVTFFLNACERVGLESYDAERREVKTEVFDSPRLVHVETGVQATTERTGGPGDPNSRPGPNAR